MGYLSDVARRRIAAMLLVAGAAVVALAIADVGPFSDPITEQERAQAAVERFFEAGQEKDFAAACGQLTKQAQRAVEQRAGAIASQRGLQGCDEILRLFLGQLHISKIVDVRVSGNRAVVDANLSAAGSSHAQPATIGLFLIKDHWKISDFGQ